MYYSGLDAVYGNIKSQFLSGEISTMAGKEDDFSEQMTRSEGLKGNFEPIIFSMEGAQL
jgi:hypothetical protein